MATTLRGGTRFGILSSAFLSFDLGIAAAQDCTFPGDPEGDPTIRLERIASGFERPVAITFAPDRSDAYFVVEQPGLVKLVPSSGGPQSTVLDLSDVVDASGNEMGLLGMAFHPRFAQTRRVFLNYTARASGRIKSRVVEMTMSANGTIAPGSERRLLEVDQPYSNHNGGDLKFGPDGYLYIGFGDGGSGGDPHGNGQNLRTLLGKMLRIDVDSGNPYAIPADNPQFPDATARREIYAYGLRNPWRYSFDRVTRELWAGDVGQNRLEEIDIIVKGANYGWNTMEGSVCYVTRDCNRSGMTLPVFEYPRSEGASITGGYVYRGTAVPELVGSYLYADYVTGKIWGLRRGDDGTPRNKLLLDSGKNISSFGEDLNGELFALDHSEGEILKLVRETRPRQSTFPKTLSETGCFRSLRPLEPVSGLVAYDVNAALWSDGAAKSRLVKVPTGSKIMFSSQGAYQFPEGTVLVKHFSLPERRGGSVANRIIETRFLVKKGAQFKGYTYRWNEQETDGELQYGATTRRVMIADSGGDEHFDWYYPSSGDCARCHVPAAGGVLGFKTSQLNRGDQLRSLVNAGILAGNVPSDPSGLPRLVDPLGAAPLDRRARSYLDVQCAHCHNRDTGTAQGEFDLREEVPFAEARLCNEAPLAGDLGVSGAKIVRPREPNRSLLWLRLHSSDLQVRMPPIAKSRVDASGDGVVKAWIEGLAQTCP